MRELAARVEELVSRSMGPAAGDIWANAYAENRERREQSKSAFAFITPSRARKRIPVAGPVFQVFVMRPGRVSVASGGVHSSWRELLFGKASRAECEAEKC